MCKEALNLDVTPTPSLPVPTHLFVCNGALEDAFLRVVDEGAASTVTAAPPLVVGLAVSRLVLAVVSRPAQLLEAMGIVTPEGGDR